MGKLAVAAACGLATLAMAPASAPAADSDEWPRASIEIFRLAPGKHEEFIREIARYDEVLKAGGQPPIKIFLHEEGADWDVIIYKPAGDFKATPAQQAAMDAKSKELRIERGAAYFVHIRRMIAEHTDSQAIGPISAGQWLKQLDQWRAENATTTSSALRPPP